MNQDEIMKYAPYIAIGFFALMALIIVPIVIRKTRKKQKAANDFFPELAAKTGLQVTDTGLHGKYKGFDIHFRYAVQTNYIGAYKRIANNSQSTMVHPTVHVTVTSPKQLPTIALYEKPGWFTHTDQRLQDAFSGRDPQYPKIADADAIRKNLDIFGTDPAAAEKLMNSAELKNLLANWKYTDIRTKGNELELTLDNSSVNATIGINTMYTHEFAIKAMDIAVETAKALN